MGVIEKAVAWAIERAEDPRSGYSQTDRWGPNFDCSSFVISAFEQAGVPLREAGASFTGNMRGPMIACGFVDVTYAIGLDTGYGLQPGDVLLNYAAHTCMAVGGGKVANCRTDEGHPESGDQSGNEIRIQNYWPGDPNRWDCVLRYKGTHVGSNVSGSDTGSGSASAPRSTLTKGMRGDDVKSLQEQLIAAGYSCGKAGADGIFGNDTFRAVAAFQEDHCLPVTGVADPATIKTINLVATDVSTPDNDTEEKFLMPELQAGDKGPAVSLLQAALNIRGYSCGTVDGIFGAKTQAALNRFKENRHLEPDGKVDLATWGKLLGVKI